MRARELGLPLTGTTGPDNAITDVPGVEVGYTTLVGGDSVRTGVTAILPRPRAEIPLPCAAGWYSLNGNGEMTGTTWIAETGALRLPVMITNTHAVGPVHRGVIDWTLRTHPAVGAEWMLPVVAETYDGYLNDINGPWVQSEHAVAAIDTAAPGPVAEGSVGGGTGMICYEFKGGSGTSSRLVGYGETTYTVGVFVQANFGRREELTVCGVPVGRQLPKGDPNSEQRAEIPPGAGSVIVIVATDAPLLPGQCTALARRVPLGLARTGTAGSIFSGDIFLAFSTANKGSLTAGFPKGEPGYDQLRFIPWNRIDPFHSAVVAATEEAVLNALVAGRTMVGRDGRRVPGIAVDRLVEMVTRAG